MKKISIVCYDSGKAKVTTSDVVINNENNATELEIDFSGTLYASENKWVDIVLSDGSSLRYDLGVGEIVTKDLEYPDTIAGEIIFTPFIYDGVNKIKYRTNYSIIVYKQKEAGTSSAIERDDYIFELKERVDAWEIPDTEGVVINEPSTESVSGLSTTQKEINIEVKNIIKPAQDDWKFPATQIKQDQTLKPDFDYTNIGLLFPQDDVSEQIYISDQRPHSMEDDSLLEPHCHLILTKAGNPKFTAMIRLTNINGLEGSFVQYDMEVLSSTWVSGRLHVLLKSNTPFPSLGKTSSAVLDVKLFRQTGDGYSGDVLLKSFDIHYTKNKFGEDV
ncbi:MAG: hypothetical protein PF487_05770 [Bacteroidales bacterium]|jgi:hypothetical protein|nr:hypothetical protein [Bacteroidales bacterium]